MSLENVEIVRRCYEAPLIPTALSPLPESGPSSLGYTVRGDIGFVVNPKHLAAIGALRGAVVM
jgi:hypothetical protein